MLERGLQRAVTAWSEASGRACARGVTSSRKKDKKIDPPSRFSGYAASAAPTRPSDLWLRQPRGKRNQAVKGTARRTTRIRVDPHRATPPSVEFVDSVHASSCCNKMKTLEA